MPQYFWSVLAIFSVPRLYARPSGRPHGRSFLTGQGPRDEMYENTDDESQSESRVRLSATGWAANSFGYPADA
jgi:hypothetical protein